MHTNHEIFNFNTTYLSLPDKFFSKTNPSLVPNPEFVLLNNDLFKALTIYFTDANHLLSLLSGNWVDENSIPFAQAYAGHQFGHFTLLGDGRAIVLGEHLTNEGRRYDIQLKGSGQTPYSRNGDGKATLKAMLREYLISEAMHHLNIPTSRSLAVIKTGELIYREKVYEGAVLTRVMKSHLRVGTFQFARHFGTIDDLKSLTHYAIQRHFPEIEQEKNPALSLLEKVMKSQINLLVNWMRVGFIHGVMNTDNTSICGETFDYGPCAFMNSYDPQTVYSSIDTHGRYAFGNQPKIIKWNMTRLAEALLPLIHSEQVTAIKLAQQILDTFDVLWETQYYKMMLNKLGIENTMPEDFILVDELLEAMNVHKLDYTNTFIALLAEIDSIKAPSELNYWIEKWKKRIAKSEKGFQKANEMMKENNPIFIPRNHLVEEALAKAIEGDLSPLEKFLEVLKTPYSYSQNFDSYLLPPELVFEKNYQTFCGT